MSPTALLAGLLVVALMLWLLRARGFPNARALRGGYEDLRAAGYATAR